MAEILARPAALIRRLGVAAGCPGETTPLIRAHLALALGRPTFDHTRYQRFRAIMRRANAAYRPGPARFEVFMATIEGRQDLIEACRRLAPDLRADTVGGDHWTMLEPPHVADLARWVERSITSARTPRTAP